MNKIPALKIPALKIPENYYSFITFDDELKNKVISLDFSDINSSMPRNIMINGHRINYLSCNNVELE